MVIRADTKWQSMQVEDILDVREWEQYAEFIRQMAELVDEVGPASQFFGCIYDTSTDACVCSTLYFDQRGVMPLPLPQPDVHTPGAKSYLRLLELYRAFHSHTNFKLAGVSWP
jgi:hypothetical protein